MPISSTTARGHVDQLLTNISVAYIQSAKNFVANKVFPVVPVAKQSNLYLIYPKGAFFRDEVAPRPLGGQSRKTQFTTDTDNYFCIEEGLSSDLDDRERANATPPYDPEQSRIRLLTQQHLIHRDRSWASQYFKTGVWNTDITGVSSSPTAGQILQWDQANSTPIEDIDEQKDIIGEATGFTPNVLVLGRKTYRVVKNHPDVVDRVKYTARGVITQDLLAELFGVDRVVVPGGIYNSATEGATDNFEFIIPSNDMLLTYAAPNPGLDQPSGGYTFSWTGLLGNSAFQSGVWRGREDRAYSDWFDVRMAYDMKKVAGDLGVFFKDVVVAG